MSRTESCRLAKRAQRDRERRLGTITISVKLSADEAAVFFAARDLQRGPVSDFAQRCMTRGAAFLANAGNRRGQKLRREAING